LEVLPTYTFSLISEYEYKGLGLLIPSEGPLTPCEQILDTGSSASK